MIGMHISHGLYAPLRMPENPHMGLAGSDGGPVQLSQALRGAAQTWRSEDSGLSHAPAQHLAQAVDALNQRLRPSHDGAHGRAQPLRPIVSPHWTVRARLARVTTTVHTADLMPQQQSCVASTRVHAAEALKSH